MSNMNWVDYVVLTIFFFSIIAGFARGLVKEILSLLSLVVAGVVASMFSSSLATMFTSNASVQQAVGEASSSVGASASQSASYIALGLSFTLIFVGTMLACALLSYFINMAFQTGVLGMGNRLLGAIFGFVRGYIINVVVIFVVQLTPFGTQPAFAQSEFVVAFQPSVQWLGNMVSPALANLKQRLTNDLQGAGSTLQSIAPGMPSV